MSHFNKQGGPAVAAHEQLNTNMKIKQMVLLAVFAALAFATMFVLRIKVSFLTFDAKDAVITLAAMMFGPWAGALISLVVALIEMITVSDTGFYGFIMNFLSSAAFSVVASAVYRRRHTLNSAIIGLCAAVVSMTAVMIVLNIAITPLYMNAPVKTVITMIPTLLLPFNLVKSLLNAGLVMILYRPVSVALRRARMLPASAVPEANHLHMNRRSVLVLVLGLAVVAACVVAFLLLMNGSFELHK